MNSSSSNISIIKIWVSDVKFNINVLEENKTEEKIGTYLGINTDQAGKGTKYKLEPGKVIEIKDGEISFDGDVAKYRVGGAV